MPGLVQSLQGADLSYLRIVAEQWKLALQTSDARGALQQLEAELPGAIAASWAQLPETAQHAITALSAADGRLPWGQFTRQFGSLREMGEARRDKDQPHLHPTSTTEVLWYRGLIGRAFFDTPDGLGEFAYLPDEVQAVLSAAHPVEQPFGRPARPEERANITAVNDRILDQACTLLAGLRMGLPENELAAAEPWLLAPDALTSLLKAARLVTADGKPIPETTRRFLEAPRGQALAMLASAWLQAADFNELRFLSGIQIEGHWENDALAARQKILAFVRSAPPGQWWSIAALVADVKSRQPDFQRPAGDYDSWYLRRAATGEYLRGFASWDQVDGALITWMLRVPLYSLGFVDLAGPAAQPAAFRWSQWADALLKGQSPIRFKVEGLKLKVDSQGKVLIPAFAPRAARYLVARFCDWPSPQKDGYVYRITAASLEKARKQGLKVRQLLALLKAHNAAPLPPNLVQALKRWELQGAQVQIGKFLVLKVGSTAALKALRASRAARYLGEPLGPAAIEVKPGAGQHVLQALLELGFLGELED